jgi:hypothetical protein
MPGKLCDHRLPAASEPPPTLREAKAYAEGRTAQFKGAPRESNPFVAQIDGRGWLWWDYGWEGRSLGIRDKACCAV